MTDTVAILDRLVAFPTVSRESNLDLLDWVEARLAPLNPRLRRFPNPEGTKANLLISLGPEGPGGLVLSGHTDVVPVENQAWTADPFALREAHGRLVGRGATDMKGFVASCLALAPEVAQGLERPLHIALSYDEEVGCTGVHDMAEWIGASGLKPGLAVIGEPSRMRLVNAHKGGFVGRCEVTGVPGHSSQPDRCVNAVMHAAEVIALFTDLRRRMREEGPHVEAFDPPWSTTQVNVIQGGEARNIVAARCTFSWEMRLLPGVDGPALLAGVEAAVRERIEPAMKAVSPEAGIDVVVALRVPALAPEADDALQNRLLGLLDQERPAAVPYGSEAGIFQRAGVPSVIIGPGDIAQAHQPDEWIERSELDRCDAVLRQLVAEFC